MLLTVAACSPGRIGDVVTGRGGGSGSGSGGNGGSGDHGPPTPLILSFVATPPSLPNGGGQTTLTWNVMNADSLSIDKGIGAVTGTSTDVHVTGTTIYTLTATNGNGASKAATAVVVGQNPATDSSGRFSAMVSPTNGESFVGPTTLRFIAAGRDPFVDTNQPSSGLGGNAAQVQFFVDDDSVLTIDGGDAQYWMFQGFFGPVAPGSHRVWARSIYTNPELVLDSLPSLITVTDAPAYGQTVDLTQDVVIAGGGAGYSLAGTAGSRVRLNGHGHSITTGNNASGALTLQFVDVFDLGNETDTSQPGINVSTSGNVIIEDSTFGTSNTVSVNVSGNATASIARNVFPSNMRMPIGQFPDAYTSPASFPAAHFGGNSGGAKVFAGNSVGAGWIEFVNSKNWVVGGDSDADSNVLIGARVGIHVQNSTGAQVRRNFSHHIYYGGWSQGNDFELQDSTPITVEHNVIYGSSWPVRGIADEFRYNLVLEAGHEWVQPSPGASIHHNVFIGGDNDVGGFYIYNDPVVPSAPSIDIVNNTMNGLNDKGIITAVKMDATTGAVSLSSNAFLNMPKTPAVSISGNPVTSDYNGFFGVMQPNYSDRRTPSHDQTAGDAMLADPGTTIFDLDESAIWNRSTSTANVLLLYRTRYTPRTGSPLLGSGDPQVTSENWIGAIGTGQSTVDRFGLP